jgi:hypothetical protein
MRFDHYKYHSAEGGRDRKPHQEIIAERMAKQAADNAERQRLSRFLHKARMEGFRAWVYAQDKFTDEEKAEMIRASFKW